MHALIKSGYYRKNRGSVFRAVFLVKIKGRTRPLPSKKLTSAFHGLGGTGRQGHLNANSPLGVLLRWPWRPTGKRRPRRNSCSFALEKNWASKPTFPSDIQRACACMAMWARMWLCFVLFFGSLVGVVAIPLLPGRPHDRAPFFGDLFCGHGKCRSWGTEGASGHNSPRSR